MHNTCIIIASLPNFKGEDEILPHQNFIFSIFYGQSPFRSALFVKIDRKRHVFSAGIGLSKRNQVSEHLI